MMTSDPIADMLTRIRNANTAKHDTVDIPMSKMKLAIAEILLNEGYIAKYDIIEDGSFKTIRVTFVYVGKNEIPRVLGCLGTEIISTNKGVITDKEARKLQVCGEVLAFFW